MSHQIHSPLARAGGDPPGAGVLPGRLVAHDLEGKSLVEFLLPERPGGEPAAPFEASWWAVDEGEETPPDCHQVRELWLVGAGAGEMRLGAERLPVRAGQVVYIPPATSHRVRATSREALNVFSVWW